MLSPFLKKIIHFLSHETSTLSTKVIQSSSSNAVMDSGLFRNVSMKICITRPLLIRSAFSKDASFNLFSAFSYLRTRPLYFFVYSSCDCFYFAFSLTHWLTSSEITVSSSARFSISASSSVWR